MLQIAVPRVLQQFLYFFAGQAVNNDGDKIQFATNKLALYAYENDLELTGESYTIMVNQNEKKLMSDIFMPIKIK